MSRKPLKKSDMGKSWMKPRRDSRQMISPEYHLIVSEGTKTEPTYFEIIKETIDNQNDIILYLRTILVRIFFFHKHTCGQGLVFTNIL